MAHTPAFTAAVETANACTRIRPAVKARTDSRKLSAVMDAAKASEVRHKKIRTPGKSLLKSLPG
jgi:hypothetical protein